MDYPELKNFEKDLYLSINDYFAAASRLGVSQARIRAVCGSRRRLSAEADLRDLCKLRMFVRSTRVAFLLNYILMRQDDWPKQYWLDALAGDFELSADQTFTIWGVFSVGGARNGSRFAPFWGRFQLFDGGISDFDIRLGSNKWLDGCSVDDAPPSTWEPEQFQFLFLRNGEDTVVRL